MSELVLSPVISRKRVAPLLGSSTLALLLHGLILLALLLQLGHAPTPPIIPERLLTIIELQPQAAAQAVAQLQSPPPTPPKPAARPRPRPTTTPPPMQHPTVQVAARTPAASAAPATPQPPAPQPLAIPAITSMPAAPVVAASGEVAPIPTAYLWDVMRMVTMYKIYPLRARDARLQGTTVIHIHLRRDGTVLEASVLKSSGFDLLDQAACAEIMRIGNFGVLPDKYNPGQADFWIDQPVKYGFA